MHRVQGKEVAYREETTLNRWDAEKFTHQMAYSSQEQAAASKFRQK